MRILFTLLLVNHLFLLHAQVTVTGFDGETHIGGSTLTKTVEFPSDLSNVSSIIMHISLSCPPGGCDPWDRFAQLSVMSDAGDVIEIGRFATPYLLSTCAWTLDVTDYRNYLTGSTELISHIETYQNGWNIHTSFEFIEGTPEFEYVEVTQFFQDNQFTYGDTLFYSINLPDHDHMIPNNAEEVVFRVINTGHGQGNTENAAEFSQKTHQIQVNGQQEFEQFLWKPDCAQNPCANQAGTWQYPRAGWCPGQAVEPWDYDITSLTSPGSSVNVDYVLEPFYNLCSPWNIDCMPSNCINGNCTYDNNGHTTPIYKVTLQMLIKSSTPVGIDEELDVLRGVSIFPIPSEGLLNITFMERAKVDLAVLHITGKVLLQERMNGVATQLDLSDKRSGVYVLQLTSEQGTHFERFILNH